MLHALNNNREAIEALRYNGYGAADFQVNKSTVYFDNEFNETELVPYRGKDVYFRSDNGEPIAIHGKRYKPLQYTHMIDKSRDMIERCKLDATGIEEKIQVSPNGGMCLVNYKLPAKEYETPDGDTGCITVMALSSFNGVWSFILSLGFEQSACLNSQIFIKNPASLYKARHTGKLDIDRGANMLGKTANIIEQEIELWHEWYNTPVTNDDIHNTMYVVDKSINNILTYHNFNDVFERWHILHGGQRGRAAARHGEGRPVPEGGAGGLMFIDNMIIDNNISSNSYV